VGRPRVTPDQPAVGGHLGKTVAVEPAPAGDPRGDRGLARRPAGSDSDDLLFAARGGRAADHSAGAARPTRRQAGSPGRALTAEPSRLLVRGLLQSFSSLPGRTALPTAPVSIR